MVQLEEYNLPTQNNQNFNSGRLVLISEVAGSNPYWTDVGQSFPACGCSSLACVKWLQSNLLLVWLIWSQGAQVLNTVWKDSAGTKLWRQGLSWVPSGRGCWSVSPYVHSSPPLKRWSSQVRPRVAQGVLHSCCPYGTWVQEWTTSVYRVVGLALLNGTAFLFFKHTS